MLPYWHDPCYQPHNDSASCCLCTPFLHHFTSCSSSLIQLCFATQIQHILHSKCGTNPRKAAPMWPSPSCKFFLLAFLMDSPWLSLCSYYGLMWPLQCPKNISDSWGWEYYHFCQIIHHMFFVVIVDNCICSLPQDSDDCSSKWSLPLKLWLLFIWQSLISSERTGV